MQHPSIYLRRVLGYIGLERHISRGPVQFVAEGQVHVWLLQQLEQCVARVSSLLRSAASTGRARPMTYDVKFCENGI